MTAQITFLGVAEGAVADARGALTLVAFNQNVWVIDQYPAHLTPTFVAIMEDEAGENFMAPDIEPAAHVTVEDEDGNTVFLIDAPRQPLPPKDWPLPDRVQVVAGIQFPVEKPGKYTLTVRMTLWRGGSSLLTSTRSRDFWVLPLSERLR